MYTSEPFVHIYKSSYVHQRTFRAHLQEFIRTPANLSCTFTRVHTYTSEPFVHIYKSSYVHQRTFRAHLRIKHINSIGSWVV